MLIGNLWKTVPSEKLWKNLALASFIFWFLSLLLPGYISYAGDKGVGGYILLSGWLGVFSFNFAWFANAFYLYAFFKIYSEDPVPVISTTIAVVLTFNTFSFEGVDEVGGFTIFGYGIGFLFWSGSFVLLAAAVFVKKRWQVIEIPPRNDEILALLVLSSLGLSLYIVAKILMSATQSSEGERAFMRDNWVFLKRLSVCEESAVAPLRTISTTGGVVEFTVSNYTSDAFRFPYAAISPFDNFTIPLDWGIPAIRGGEFDYFIATTHKEHTYAARPKQGEPVAILTTGRLPTHSLSIHALPDNSTLYANEWLSDTSSRLCGYNFNAGKGDDPQSIVTETLQLTAVPEPAPPAVASADVIATGIGGVTFETGSVSTSENFGCPADSKFVSSGEWRGLSSMTGGGVLGGSPFFHNGVYYFHSMFSNSENSPKYFCRGDEIYLVKSGNAGANDDEIQFEISQRSSNAFEEYWHVVFRTKNFESLPSAETLSIEVVESTEAVARLAIVNRSQNEFKFVDVTL